MYNVLINTYKEKKLPIKRYNTIKGVFNHPCNVNYAFIG